MNRYFYVTFCSFFKGLLSYRLMLLAFTAYCLLFPPPAFSADLNSKVHEIDSCPYYIATLATTEYLQQLSYLKHQIVSFSNGVCDLRTVQTGSFQEVSKFKVVSGRQYPNEFSGVDIKISAVLDTLKSLPVNSTLLWLDASTIVLNSIDTTEGESLLHGKDLLFAQQVVGKKFSANIGVILMKNTPQLVIFFDLTLTYIRAGYWDQGIICCLLGIPTRHSCEHIERYRGKIKWSYLKRAFAAIKSIKGKSKCRFDNNVHRGKRKLPVFLKLIGDKEKRSKCLKLFREGHQNLHKKRKNAFSNT